MALRDTFDKSYQPNISTNISCTCGPPGGSYGPCTSSPASLRNIFALHVVRRVHQHHHHHLRHSRTHHWHQDLSPPILIPIFFNLLNMVLRLHHHRLQLCQPPLPLPLHLILLLLRLPNTRQSKLLPDVQTRTAVSLLAQTDHHLLPSHHWIVTNTNSLRWAIPPVNLQNPCARSNSNNSKFF